MASRLKALAKFLPPIYFNAAICCMHFAYHRRLFGFFLLTFALTSRASRCREDLLSFAFLPSFLHTLTLIRVSLSRISLALPLATSQAELMLLLPLLLLSNAKVCVKLSNIFSTSSPGDKIFGTLSRARLSLCSALAQHSRHLN